ncbi:CRAL-TRIO domain-containing protein [Balamuthia mandrillaris]
MLSASLKWRKQVGADNILEEAPKSDYFLLLHRYWPSRFHKTDREGSLVLFERIGVADAKALVSAVPREECIRYHVWQQEYARLLKKEMSSKEGTNKFPQVIVADLAGLGWSHMHGPAIDVFKQIVAIDEANYPECLKAFYVINAPKLFTMAFRMIRPLLDPKTLSKVHVLGADYKEALLEAIHEDNLPKAYGGNCDCGGTSCQGYFHDETEVVVPFWDSERQEVLYRSFLSKEDEGEEMKKSKNKEKDEKETEALERHCIPGGGAFDGVEREEDGTNRLPIQVVVGRKAVHEVVVNVEASNLNLTWEFSTVDNDISFGVFGQEEGQKNRTEIVPLKRHASHVEPVQGSIAIDRPGRYVLVWDNSFSLWKKKQLTYQIQLVDSLLQE